MTYVNHVNLLEEHSTWRKYERGLRELTLLEAPKSIIAEYKHKAAETCFLAFADLMLDGKSKKITNKTIRPLVRPNNTPRNLSNPEAPDHLMSVPINLITTPPRKMQTKKTTM